MNIELLRVLFYNNTLRMNNYDFSGFSDRDYNYTKSNPLKPKLNMIYIEESLYRYYKEQGIYLPEKETIVVPDHKTKEGLITFCPERMTKTRRKQREEEKKKALAYDLGYDKLKKEYEEEIRKRNAGKNNN